MVNGFIPKWNSSGGKDYFILYMFNVKFKKGDLLGISKRDFTQPFCVFLSL